MNREAYFNELSLDSGSQIDYEEIQRIARIYQGLKAQKFNTCRISPEARSELLNQAKSYSNYRTLSGFLYSFFKTPYDANIPEAPANEYLSHSWSCQGRECYGLALAYIMESLSVSIAASGNSEWNHSTVSIQRDDAPAEVRNVSDPAHLDELADWFESLEEIQLAASDLKPEEKGISLRDDHGKDVLQKFAERLVRCPYVDSVIGSRQFQPHARHFYEITDYNLIRIILYWDDRGLCMEVRTTARNRRENEKIAELLKQKYGKL